MGEIGVQLFSLFGFILSGFICNKIGIFDETSDKYFSNFLLKITLPAAIIASAAGQNLENKLSAFIVLGLATGIFIITPLLGILFQKIFKSDDMYKLMLTYPNLGFMGFPIVKALYGETGLFFASLFMIVFNLSIFSYGISVVQKGTRLSLKKLLNPGIAAAIMAIIIFVFSIPVPIVLENFLSKIGGITSPLAMVTIGSTLAEVHFRSLFKEKFLFFFSFCKLVVWPCIIWFLLHFIIQDPVILGVCVILTSLPVAGNVTMFAITYNGNRSLAVKGTCMSTILSFLTIPVYMILFSQ